MKFVFFRFRRTEKMDSVMKGLMGQCTFRILGLEPPLDILPLPNHADDNDNDDAAAAAAAADDDGYVDVVSLNDAAVCLVV